MTTAGTTVRVMMIAPATRRRDDSRKKPADLRLEEGKAGDMDDVKDRRGSVLTEKRVRHRFVAVCNPLSLIGVRAQRVGG